MCGCIKNREGTFPFIIYIDYIKINNIAWKNNIKFDCKHKSHIDLAVPAKVIIFASYTYEGMELLFSLIWETRPIWSRLTLQTQNNTENHQKDVVEDIF